MHADGAYRGKNIDAYNTCCYLNVFNDNETLPCSQIIAVRTATQAARSPPPLVKVNHGCFCFNGGDLLLSQSKASPAPPPPPPPQSRGVPGVGPARRMESAPARRPLGKLQPIGLFAARCVLKGNLVVLELFALLGVRVRPRGRRCMVRRPARCSSSAVRLVGPHGTKRAWCRGRYRRATVGRAGGGEMFVAFVPVRRCNASAPELPAPAVLSRGGDDNTATTYGRQRLIRDN